MVKKAFVLVDHHVCVHFESGQFFSINYSEFIQNESI